MFLEIWLDWIVLEIFTKYLLNAVAMTSNLVNEILFSITVEGTEFEVLFRDITFLIPSQYFLSH